MKARLLSLSFPRNLLAERGPSPRSRSWLACERLSVAPRSGVETAFVVEEEFVTTCVHVASLHSQSLSPNERTGFPKGRLRYAK